MTLSYIQAASISIFGFFLSFLFSGVHLTKKNMLILTPFTVVFSCIMAISIIMPNVNLGWRIMPLLGHLPNLLFLLFYFKKRFATSVAAICTAFLMCLPPRVLFNIVAPYIPDILVLKLLVLNFLSSQHFCSALKPPVLFRQFSTRITAVFTFLPASLFCFILPTIFWKSIQTFGQVLPL